MKLLLFITFVFLSLSSSSQPQVIINDNCKKAYQEILSLRFEEAEQILETEKAANPNNIYVPYLENYIDFLSVFISEDETMFDRLEENKSERIDQIKKLSNTSPYRDFLLGNINLQWAVARLKFQEYFIAAFEINKAYRLLESNRKTFPDFIPNNISLGVLHIMIGLVPSKYQWLLDIIDMEGNVDQGKSELRLVLQNSMEDKAYHYLKNEVLFYLGFVELNIYPDEKELEFLLSHLENEEQDNLLLSYLTINILMRTGNNEEVLSKFEQLPELSAYFPFYYLRYLEAECQLRKLETEQAKIQYDFFLENYNGQNYIKDAYRKKAWSSLLNSDTLRYQELMTRVIENGHMYIGQDKDAEREANSEGLPNVDLIKARLLFDGGYYKQADSILHSMDTTHLSEVQTIERVYRKARIAHQTQNIQLAMSNYLKTITIGKDNPRYFAGNAALKLGEIYEADSNYQDALYYYQVCLDLDFDEYESGIHSKARAGLKRVSE